MRQTDFVSEYRREVTVVLKAIERLQNLQQEATLMNWPTQLNSDIAFQGENSSLTIESLGNAMTTAAGILADISPEELAALYTIRN